MLIGKGSKDKFLSQKEILDLCAEAFSQKDLTNKRVLVIIPDHTRTAPIGPIFKILYEQLAQRTKVLDFMVALGTHPPMSQKALLERVGITESSWKSIYTKVQFFNHNWKDANQLQHIGTITAEELAEISNGFLEQDVEITINKKVFEYDLLLIVGPTFPHEVVGFSGGNKYLFPGISGQEIIDITHWLGALITNPLIIGIKDTPVRKIIDIAANFLSVERMCISLVVQGEQLAGIFIGTPEKTWNSASDLSKKLHIIYKDHPYHKVLSCAPKMYDDLWTGGKCMYKLEPVVADGGELIIYAPHISQVSISHGAIIEQIGYHTRDYFVMQKHKFQDIAGGLLAHSTHVKGIGTFEGGIEKPRIEVKLATQISENTCKKINLGYCDPNTINIEEWQNRENEGILFVPKAGETLFRLKDDPFHK
jgi:nickel-dependent lactate racemase